MISETIQAICDNAIRSSRRGDTRTGIELARQAYRLARRESAQAELEALNASAICQAANGCFIEAIASAIDAISLARQHSNQRAASEAMITMAGAASFILEANSVVLEMLTVCRFEADKLADKSLQVRIHNTFGLIYGNLSRFDDADREYDEGIALVGRADERARMLTPAYLMSGNRAYLSVQRARAATPETFGLLVADADARIRHVLGIANTEMNIDAEARAFFCLGQLLTLQRQNDDALHAFGEALTRATQIRHHPRLIDTNIEISKLHASALQFELALEAMESAYEFADASRPTAKVSLACEGIAAMYEKLGRERETAHYHAKALREREAFERDNEYALRDLNSFWRQQVAEQA